MEDAHPIMEDEDLSDYAPTPIDENPDVQNLEMSKLQKIRLKIFGKVYIKKAQLENWTDSLPFYAFKCPTHGLQVTYPMGWQATLTCPTCIDDL